MSRIRTLAAALAAIASGAARRSVEAVRAAAHQGAAILRGIALREQISLSGTYRIECVAADGSLRWSDEIRNLVVTVGKNDLLDKYFSGSAYTAAFYLGLIGSTGYTTGAAAGDTMAAHGGWAEDTTYSNATRPAPSWSSASAGSKASTATAFNVNGTATIKGAFLSTSSSKGGGTGTLYSAGLFSGGDRAVVNGDTLNVTYTASA